MYRISPLSLRRSHTKECVGLTKSEAEQPITIVWSTDGSFFSYVGNLCIFCQATGNNRGAREIFSV